MLGDLIELSKVDTGIVGSALKGCNKQKAATGIPQIFVPYKETLDIYDAGLRVPDDITLVWPDDNYGYMKRTCSDKRTKKRRTT